MKNPFPHFILFLILGPVWLSAQQNLPAISIQGESSAFSSTTVDELFLEKEIYQIDFSSLLRQTKNQDVIRVQMQLGEHDWDLMLLHHDLRRPNAREKTTDGDQIIALERRRATTFKGYCNSAFGAGESVRLNLSDSWISGYITEQGQEYFIEPLRMTDPTAPEGYFILYRPQDVIEKEEHPCTVESMKDFDPGQQEEQLEEAKSSVMLSCVEVELVTACTWDYVSALGGVNQANDRIVAITNLVEGLYEPFDLAYAIVEQFAPASAAADPFTTSTDAITIMHSMRNYAQNNMATHDVGQIWTDRDIQGCGSGTGLVGCAWIGTICDNLRYNVCENYSINDNCLRALSAHEFGHNWNAEHDFSTNTTLMRPTINCNATTFTDVNSARIQDLMDMSSCLDQMANAVEGQIVHHCDFVSMPNVAVNMTPLVGANSTCRAKQTLTDNNGEYTRCLCSESVNYIVRPVKDGNDDCGVSTYDMVFIQRHILGTVPLNDPYRLIAADVNYSGSVSTIDLVRIRQLVLGQILAFPDGDSWEFVDANYNFPSPQNPFNPPFPDFVNLQLPDSDASFFGVKKGDVNCSCDAVTALVGNTSVFMATQPVDRGQIFTIELKAKDMQEVIAYQLGLNYDSRLARLEGISAGNIADFSLDNFNSSLSERGKIKSIWLSEDGKKGKIQKGATLFRLHFTALQAISNTREVLQLDNSLLENQSISAETEVYGVQLDYIEGDRFTKRTEATTELFTGIRLQPNPVDGDQLTIALNLAEESELNLYLFDINGRLIRQEELQFTAGYQQFRLTGMEALQSGVYTYRLSAKQQTFSGKLIVQ